jgi:hypothetical protein
MYVARGFVCMWCCLEVIICTGSGFLFLDLLFVFSNGAFDVQDLVDWIYV